MRCKLVFLIGLLLIINSAFAQWHFSASIVYYGNCNHGQIYLYESWKSTIETVGNISYPTKQDCESVKQGLDGIYNLSVDGCTIKTTLSPCTGTDMNASSGGLYSGTPSLYNSNGAGGFVFSPTESEINQNMVEELLMKMQAFNKNYNNAKNFNSNKMSAKSGDDDFDSKYINDIKNNVKKKKDNNNELKPTQFFYNLSMRRTGALLYGDNYYPAQIIQPGYDDGRFKYNDDVKNGGSNYFDEANNKLISGELKDITGEIITTEGLWSEKTYPYAKSAVFGAKVVDALYDGDVVKAGSMVFDKMVDVTIKDVGGKFSNMIKAGKEHVKNVHDATTDLFSKDFAKNLVNAVVLGKTEDVKKVNQYWNGVMERFARKNVENIKSYY